MKIKVDADEWYPVYSRRDADAYGGYEVDASEEQVSRWAAAFVAFEKAQEEIGELHRAAEEVAREKAAAEKADREAAEKAERQRRQREIEDKNRRYRKAVERAVGTVYDVDNNPIGEVSEGNMGLKFTPSID